MAVHGMMQGSAITSAGLICLQLPAGVSTALEGTWTADSSALQSARAYFQDTMDVIHRPFSPQYLNDPTVDG